MLVAYVATSMLVARFLILNFCHQDPKLATESNCLHRQHRAYVSNISLADVDIGDLKLIYAM